MNFYEALKEFTNQLLEKKHPSDSCINTLKLLGDAQSEIQGTVIEFLSNDNSLTVLDDNNIKYDENFKIFILFKLRYLSPSDHYKFLLINQNMTNFNMAIHGYEYDEVPHLLACLVLTLDENINIDDMKNLLHRYNNERGSPVLTSEKFKQLSIIYNHIVYNHCIHTRIEYQSTHIAVLILYEFLCVKKFGLSYHKNIY